MTADIHIPFGNGVKEEICTAVKGEIGVRTDKTADYEVTDREIIIFPSDPIHADRILHELDSLGYEYTHD